MVRCLLIPFLIAFTLDLSLAPPSIAASSDEPRKPIAADMDHPGATAESSADDRDAADWLVLLARHQGSIQTQADPHLVSLHVQALLEAARGVSSKSATAYYWLYDIHARAGRQSEALMALAKYSSLTPQDQTAKLILLDLELQRLQTPESRAEFLRGELKLRNLPKSYAAELHYQLARYHRDRREFEPATREIEQTLRANPLHLAARRLAYELFDETDEDLQRVEAALQLLSLNPSQVVVVWDLAELLDQLSLHRPAQDWYQRAIDLHRRAGGGPIPGEYWHRIALSYLSAGDFDKARQAAESALAVDPPFEPARLLLVHALRELRDPRADDELQLVRAAYERRTDEIIRQRRFAEAAEAAWFFAYHSPDPDRAIRLSRLAMSEEPPSDFAKLAFGRALHLNGQDDNAIPILTPLSAKDQFAALSLAEIKIARGRKAEAVTILQKAAPLAYSGIAYEQIRSLLEAHHEQAPQCPTRPKVLAALDRFPKQLFDFHIRPQDFISLTIRPTDAGAPAPEAGTAREAAFADAGASAVDPIRLTIRMENTGPFHIGLGEGMMLRPLVVVQAEVKDGPSEPRLISTLLNESPFLSPGESVEQTIPVNIGPIRDYLIAHSQKPQTLTFTALLDPVFEHGLPAPLVGALSSRPTILQTIPIGDTPEAQSALIARAASPITAERIEAVDKIGAVLCALHDMTAEPNTATSRIDELQTAMARLLSDPEWTVRAHALVAAGWTRLDPRTTVAAAPCVRDENAVVKLLAVRLFAEQHGEKFRMPLEQLSRIDPSPCVRMMAESFLPIVSTAADDDDNPAQ